MKQSNEVLAEVNGILGQALSDRDSIIAGKDHQVEILQNAAVTYRKVISENTDVVIAKDQEIFNLKAVNEIQKNRLTELSKKVDDAMKFVDQTRIVLFDVVRMYGELEAARDTKRTD